MPTLEDLRKMKTEYQEALKSSAKDALREHFAGLFAAHPDVAGIRWTQYTPHFNDGEPCTFRVNEADVLLVGGDPDREDDPKGWSDYHDTKGGESYRDIHPVYKAAALDEDIAETLGDGVQVTILRDLTMTVEDYDHG
jgi:hypothetical protein